VDLVQEHGCDHAQTNLLSGLWPAFKLDLSTGDLKPIPAPIWGARRGRTWLEQAASGAKGFVGPPASAEFGFSIAHYAVLVQVAERQPPSMDNSEDEDGPKVRLARELMGAVFPQDEWRQMKIKAVQKGCEQEAKTRGVPLPSPDSFARAMGRRRRRK
jgi:hypothetical protein